MRSWVLLALVGSVLLVSACGGGAGSGSSEAEIRATIEEAALSNDPADCVRLVTPKLLRQTTKMPVKSQAEVCAELAALDSPLPDRVTVTEVAVDGDTATAHVAFEGSGNDGQTIEYGLVERDGQWKVDEMLSFVEFDRDRMILEGGRSIMEGAKSAREVQLMSCVAAQLEELGDARLEEITLSFSVQPIIDLFLPCEPSSATA